MCMHNSFQYIVTYAKFPLQIRAPIYRYNLVPDSASILWLIFFSVRRKEYNAFQFIFKKKSMQQSNYSHIPFYVAKWNEMLIN